MSIFNRSPRSERGAVRILATIMALLMVPASILGLAALGLPVAGVDLFSEEEVAAQETPAATIARVDYNNTAAGQVFRKTFRNLDRTWEPSPIEVASAGLPHPLECVTPAPTLSNSKAFVANNEDVQVTLAAYPAGLGGEMFNRLKNQVYECKPSTTSVYLYDESGLGVEAQTVQVTWGENAIRTTFFRRGDVIAFVATNAGADSYSRAAVVDGLLDRFLKPTVCMDQGDRARDALRNAVFADARFTGNQETYGISTRKLALPKLSKAQRRDSVEKVALPAAKLSTPVVTIPSDAYPYPLWPPLPEAAVSPTYPSDPKDQKLKDITRIRVPDLQGPGCGWEFLSTVKPDYNASQVEDANEDIIKNAQAILDSDGPRWRKDVLAYWDSYNTYVNQVNAYRDYASDVEAVRVAWEAIHEDWDQYYTDYANWEVYDDQRNAFIAEKELARVNFEAAKDACVDYDAAVGVYNQEFRAYEEDFTQYEEDFEEYQELRRDDDPENDIERPVRPVPPTQPSLPSAGCPPTPPAILSQDPPALVAAPAAPEDPRPPSAR